MQSERGQLTSNGIQNGTREESGKQANWGTGSEREEESDTRLSFKRIMLPSLLLAKFQVSLQSI